MKIIFLCSVVGEFGIRNGGSWISSLIAWFVLCRILLSFGCALMMLCCVLLTVCVVEFGCDVATVVS